MSKETKRDESDLTVAAVVAVAVTVAAIGLFAMLAIGPAAANHGDDVGNYTVVLPEDTDHLPGDQNEENASMQNFASAGERFEQEGAPNGFETLEYLEVTSSEVDFSACGSSNTAVFGVDRGNNNSGTQTDDDLLQHMKDSNFHEDGIEVEFYGEDDLGGEPTYLNPEDAIVSVQGAGSAGGPCFTMPTEEGWYQLSGMVEGTTEDGETIQVESESHYFPICEGCHDEQTAEEKLGPPPSQEGGGDGGADEGDAGDEEAGDGGADEGDAGDEEAGGEEAGGEETEGDEEAGGEEAGGEETEGEQDGSADEGDGSAGGDAGDEETGDDATEDGATEDGSEDGAAGDDGTGDDDGAAVEGADDTPSDGDGPGFGAVAAVVALLASALLVTRRD